MRFKLLVLFLLAAVVLYAAPPFDDRWDGTGYRPEPQTAVPGVTQPPTWMILDDNVHTTAWLKSIDDTSDPAATYKWAKVWRQYHPTENKVAVQIRAEANRCFTAAEFAVFIDDPLPAEWWSIPEM
jgi:hypothetical protein